MLRRSLLGLVLFGTFIAATVFHRPVNVLATAAKGYESTLLAKGRFGADDLSNLFPRGLNADEDKQLRRSLEEGKGSSDVYVQSNVWAAGGSTGWHSHPGRSLIIVTAGAVTDYDGHDPECKPHVYKTGMTFVDSGGDRMHILRNEGGVEAKTITVQFIPADAARRIEVADPGNCHFR